jgi:hypothetical protein
MAWFSKYAAAPSILSMNMRIAAEILPASSCGLNVFAKTRHRLSPDQAMYGGTTMGLVDSHFRRNTNS